MFGWRFWVLVGLFVAGIIIQYPQRILKLDSPSVFSVLGLTGHTVERVYLLIPITFAGLVFGFRASMLALTVALLIMLPRIFLPGVWTESLPDVLLETAGVVLTGALVNKWFDGLKREMSARQQAFDKLQETEQDLRQSEQKYRHLFENASDAIWVHDLDGRFINGNKAFEKLSGHTLQEWASMKIPQHLNDESLALAREVRRRILDGEEVKPYEQRFTMKDGTVKVVRMSTTPIMTDGKISGFENVAVDMTEELQLRQSLHSYIEEVTKAQEEERKRIARELHDDVAPSLLILIQRLDRITDGMKRLPRAMVQSLEGLRSQAIEALEGLRRTAQDLRPRIIDDLGLVAALEWLTDNLAKDLGITAEVKIKGKECALPAETQLLIFRIAQEGLNNIRKHAEASRVTIALEFGEGNILLSVTDNGKGFKVPDKLGDLANIGRLGILGMCERARLLGGTVEVTSGPGKGTRVTLELPLPVLAQLPR